MKKTTKVFLGISATPWLYFPLTPIFSYYDRSPPDYDVYVPPEFKMAFSRDLDGGLFPDGDTRFIRYTSKYSTKEAVSVLVKTVKCPYPSFYRMGDRSSTPDDIAKRNATIKSLYWPSIPQGPVGNCKIVWANGTVYCSFYIYPDENGGTIIDFIQGFNS